jgi:Protein of unknown function (DUF1501)
VGGPPQHDTWDLKPAAPANIRGELRPIETNVAGIRISELFPRLARHADQYTLVRSVTHQDTVHTTAGYTMLTGVYHPNPNEPTGVLVKPEPNDHPHVGSLVARARGPRQGLPPFVALPEVVKDANVNEVPGQRAGFLGRRYDPLLIEPNADRTRLRLPDVLLPRDVTGRRLHDRRLLREAVSRRFDAVQRGGRLADVDDAYRQAFAMVSSPAAREAFDLGREPARTAEAYGTHLFGQGCLLARRLVEAGISLVTVYWHYEGPDDSPVWDTHWNNYPHLRNRLMPPTDQAVAALLEDLHGRGLLDETLVIVMGEFGRTPKINGKGGRDHWPHVQSILLAGGGIVRGQVYGASDAEGARPIDRPVTPPDLTATFLHLLGVPAGMELRDLFGRPLRACTGEAVRGLLA